jgi:hypothetical protein
MSILNAHKWLRLATWVAAGFPVADGATAGPGVLSSAPAHVSPADLVDPPAYTVGPGTIYVEREAWMLILIPGSAALYAPGNITKDGLAAPPPVTVI